MLERFLKRDELVPESLREPFEKAFVEPLLREKREGEIAVQLKIPAQIERVQARIDALRLKKTEADAVVENKERAFKQCETELQEAKNAQEALRWQIFELRGEVESLEARRRAYGSQLLDEFIWRMLNQWHDVRSKIRTEERLGKRNTVTGKSKTIISTNAPAICKAVDAIRGVIAQAEAMKSLPLTDEDVKKKLAELEKAIPSIEQWTTVESEPAVIIDIPPPRYRDPEPLDA